MMATILLVPFFTIFFTTGKKPVMATIFLVQFFIEGKKASDGYNTTALKAASDGIAPDQLQ